MSQVYIHIGCHKTGTSYLQEYFFPNIKDIMYYYKTHNYDRIPDLGLPILISDEEISMSLPHKSDDYLELLKLYKTYPDAKIIIGVRDYKTWFKSCYAQYIKSGGYMTFKQYKYRYLKTTPSPGDIFQFVVDEWGIENVILYHQEELLYNKDEMLKFICDSMEVEMPRYETKVVNVAIKNLKFWRLVNILLRGEFLRKHIESPWWIITFIPRQFAAIKEALNG